MEAELFAVLAPLFDGRVYPEFPKPGTAKPYCTYQQVGGVPLQYLEGSPAGGTARMQINVWAGDHPQAVALKNRVEALLLGPPLFAGAESGAVSTTDTEIPLYGFMQDFSLKYIAG